MGYGYTLFEWDPVIEINETMANDKEENVMVGEKFQFNLRENL